MKKILVLAISFIIIFSSSCFAKDIFIETRLNNLSFIENYSKANNINNILDDMLEPPFFYARTIESIKTYKDNKANFLYISELGKTPLFTYFDVYSDDNPEVVKEFIKNGVNPFAKDYEGLNAADYALMNDRINCLIYLIDCNASPTIVLDAQNKIF